MHWHLLDTGSPWLKEFASALGTLVPTRNWCPELRNLGFVEAWQRRESLSDPKIDIVRFPMQRAYGRFPLAQLLPTARQIVRRLTSEESTAEESILICTNPFYAPVAEKWRGPVIYYLTDLTKAYAGMDPNQIRSLDRRMCRVARTVCPNSSRIADYLADEASCPPEKITVIPNATRASNVLAAPLLRPLPPPVDLADLPRPIVGVVGSLISNMDWLLTRDAVDMAPGVSWAFVGPTDVRIDDSVHERARKDLMSRGGRIRFVGGKPYGALASYARCFDAAFMPYRKQEPTYSGSATRFYEHLAACRPILASRGFHELLSKEAFLTLLDTGEEVAGEIDRLRACGFTDGREEARWRASQNGTWMVRARDLMSAAGYCPASIPGIMPAVLKVKSEVVCR